MEEQLRGIIIDIINSIKDKDVLELILRLVKKISEGA